MGIADIGFGCYSILHIFFWRRRNYKRYKIMYYVTTVWIFWDNEKLKILFIGFYMNSKIAVVISRLVYWFPQSHNNKKYIKILKNTTQIRKFRINIPWKIKMLVNMYKCQLITWTYCSWVL